MFFCFAARRAGVQSRHGKTSGAWTTTELPGECVKARCAGQCSLFVLWQALDLCMGMRRRVQEGRQIHRGMRSISAHGTLCLLFMTCFAFWSGLDLHPSWVWGGHVRPLVQPLRAHTVRLYSNVGVIVWACAGVFDYRLEHQSMWVRYLSMRIPPAKGIRLFDRAMYTK